MTTPAGWYDDGSGDRRWWDGTGWTSHVVAAPQPSAEEVPAFTPPFTPPATEPEQNPYIRTGTPGDHAAFASPPYVSASPQTYPQAYTQVPQPPVRRPVSVLGLIGLIAAVSGVILACIPSLAVVGWIVLGVALVCSVVSLFLRQAKWPGITGIAVSVLGAILALAVGLITWGFTSFADTITPSYGSGDGGYSDDGSTNGGSTDDGDDAGQDPSDIDGAEMVTFDDLEVGDCIPLVEYGDEDIYALPVVPCDLPHTDEVFYIYQVDDGEFPGDAALREEAADTCLAEFEPYVGISYDDSELDYYTYWPTKESWMRADDRTVHCILFSYDDVTESLKGAAY